MDRKLLSIFQTLLYKKIRNIHFFYLDFVANFVEYFVISLCIVVFLVCLFFGSFQELGKYACTNNKFRWFKVSYILKDINLKLTFTLIITLILFWYFTTGWILMKFLNIFQWFSWFYLIFVSCHNLKKCAHTNNKLRWIWLYFYKHQFEDKVD